METSLTDQLFKEPSLTDQLVESKEPEQQRVFSFPKTPYDDLMKSASEEHGVPYDVLYGVLKRESSFNPKAVPPNDPKTGKPVSSAKGIAQFIDATAKDMGVKDPFDPNQAIPGAAKYLSQNYKKFGDWKHAVAAYYQGPGEVTKHKGVPPTAEGYVKDVFKEGVNTSTPIKSKEMIVETSLTDQLFKVEKPKPFDPEGSDYDYETAKKYGIKPDKTGHWPSREPSTGMLLKGKGHETWPLTEKGESEVGNVISKNPSDGRYYSVPKAPNINPKDYYSRTLMSPLAVLHPAQTAMLGRQAFGPSHKYKVDELGRPVDDNGVAYADSDQVSMETKKSLDAFANLGGRVEVLSQDQSKPNYIRRAAQSLQEILGIESKGYLSNTARQQAVVQIMAKEARVPLSEYRQSPEFVEKAASSFVNMATFGMIPAIRESMTGEVDFPSTSLAGYSGQAIGSLAGLILSPAKVAESMMRPVISFLPRATQEGAVVTRILQEALHDSVILGPAMGLAALGEAGKSVTFEQASGHIYEGMKSGAMTGAVFGFARGLFPAEGLQKGARLMTGLLALNAQRAYEVKGNPFVNRPIGEVMFDIGLDAIFLWRGLPPSTLDSMIIKLDNIVKEKENLNTKKEIVGGITDDAIRMIQEKELAVQTQMHEAKLAKLIKEFNGDVEAAMEWAGMEERIAQEKMRPELEASAEIVKTAKKVEKAEALDAKTQEIVDTINKRINDNSERLNLELNKGDLADKAYVEGIQKAIDADVNRINKLKEKAKAPKEKTKTEAKVEELKKDAGPEVGETVVDPKTGKKTFKVKEEVERRSQEYVPATVEETLSNFPVGKETDSLVNRYRMEDNLHMDGEGNYKIDSYIEASEIAKDKGGTVIPLSDGKFAVALEPQKRVMFEKSALDKGAKEQAAKDAEQKLQKVEPKVEVKKRKKVVEKNKLEPLKTVYETGGLSSELQEVVDQVKKERLEKDKVAEEAQRIKDQKEYDEAPSPEEELSPQAKAALDRLIEETDAEVAAEAEGKPTKVPKPKKPVKPSDKIDYLAEEKISDVDVQTGTEVPEITGDKGVFWRSKEETLVLDQAYKERRAAVESDPEVYIQKLINDIRMFQHGDKTINIDAVRDKISEMAVRSSELRGFFMTGADHLQFIELAREAAKWARGVGRSGSGKGTSTQLNMMVPVDKIPRMLLDMLMKIKEATGTVKVKDVIRNYEIFRKTGMWYGRDHKWRYELDDSQSKYAPPKYMRELYDATGEAIGPLKDALYNPKLFKDIPELQGILLKLDKNLSMDGQYDPSTRIISIKRLGDKKTLGHEVQHAVNEIMGSTFLGTSEARQHQLAIADRVERIAKGLPDEGDRNYLLKAVKNVREKYHTFDKDMVSKLRKAGVKGIDKTVEDLINFPTGAFEKYARDPGEMEARVVERRLHMTHAERISEAPWETLDKMLVEEYRPIGVGYTLYSGDPAIEALTKGTIKAYHWSKDKVKGYFDFGRLGENTKGNNPQAMESAKLGAWFTESDKPIAEGLKERNEVRLDLKNPLVLNNKTVPEIDVMGQKMKDAKQHLMNEVERAGGGEKYRNELKKQGYDGIILEDSEFDGAKSYIVFDSKQAKFYSGDPAIESAAKAIIAGAKKVGEYTTKARSMKDLKLNEAWKMVRQEFNRAFIDRSGNIRREMIKRLGDEGYEVIMKLILSKGASARSAMELKQMRSEVYDGLSKREKKILDDIILADRMIDIAKYKAPGEYNFPGGMKPGDFIAYRQLFANLEKLSPERAQLLDARAKAYFEWMRKPLKDMLESGLIDQAEHDLLASHNYRKTKLVDIFDKKRPAVGTKGKSVYDSGVEALSRGRDTDIYEPSSEIMALEVFNRTYGRILNNEANKSLAELAKNNPDNGFARVKEKGNPIPSGWHRVFYYEGGERKSVFVSPEMAKEWINSSPEMSYRLSQFIRWSSGSVVTRTFATGVEWGFALANLPRDMMHLWFAARTFENGKWKPIYNPNLPIFGLQLTRDIASVFADAALKKGRYNDYIKEGGGMEFLVHQGRLFQRGRHLESGMDKIYNVLGYLGETSEVLTRLAIRERVIRRKAREEGISMEEARKNKKITDEATFAARDYMDFGQGGGITKALDNGMPYLNATVVGTRGLFRTFIPGSGSALSSTYKLAQLAALTTGVYIAAKSSSPETMEALYGDVAMQNNLCIPLGDQFSFLDEQGQERYMYLKVPLDPGQKFFKTFFEASADKWLGNEVDVDRVTGSLKELSPAGMSSLPPTVSGALGYATNRNFWLNEDIWKGSNKPFSYPNSKEEYTDRTPQVYKDFGQVTGMSPERTKYAVEQLVTQGSMWSYLLNQGYDKTFGDLTKERKEQHIGMVLSQVPIAKRFFGVTKPYAKHAAKFDESEEMSTLKKFTENRGMDTLVDSYLYGTNTTRQEVIDYARSFKDVETYDRLIERFSWEESIKTLPEKSFWKRMKGLDTEAKATMFVDRLQRSNAEERKQLWREFAIVGANKGIITDDFILEINKLRQLRKES